MGFVRPWKRCGCLSSVCTLRAQIYNVWLCFGARCVVVVLDIFRAPPISQQLIFASRAFQQKGNRCAVMSTVDYSCNIARKYAPPQLRPSVKTTLLSILPDEHLLGDKPRSWQLPFSIADRDTIRLVHTHFWSTLPLPSLPKHRERSAYALSVLVQVDLLLPRRHLSGYWMWYREKLAKNSSWVPACCLLKLRCRTLCSTFRGNCM